MSDDSENTSSNQGDGGDAKVVDSILWVKDASGYGSVTVTLLTVSFWITTLYFIATMFTFPAGWPVQLKPFDVSAVSVYFIPILTLYGHRKWADRKYEK